ncbi:MFS general substrate transporter [Penicillium nucicola]|uniref:MFS general substrate transporter n=1 Tax=Penicillium nucicola TaxID=1850975 RepID=UPI002545981C|nr:MFS general substrate transporter [Penicillium nucicola]KAJ5748269.1 MFS general substrate transporter [Penicillium nucicola]
MPASKGSASDHVEYTPGKDVDTNDLAGRMPACLVTLSSEEREEMEKKLVRKIDLRLLIMMVVMYILNYLDRNNIASAKLAGLEDDLNLKGEQYQTAVSVLFVGYLLMQVPSNMILNKFGKPSVYLPSCMMAWGIVSTCTAATQSYGGLLACRFILGFVEAAYFPGCLYLLSAWYTRKELVKRTALLYSGSLISGAFSGLIAAGITHGLSGARGISAWRWLFIIEGAITALATWRLEEDIGEEDWVDSEHQSMFHGAKLAFKDYKVWLLLGTIYGCTASGAVTTFFPIVMAGLGKDSVTTLLLTTPPYLIGTIIVLIAAWHADKTGERYLHIALPPILAIACFILAVTTSSFAPRYVAMCIMIGAIYSAYVVALGYISNILPRPATKRAAALALINCLSNVCQVYTPYLYPNSAGPQYRTAFCYNIGMSAMTICFATVLRIVLGHLNKQLDQEEGTNIPRPDIEQEENEENGLPGRVVTQGFRFML